MQEYFPKGFIWAPPIENLDAALLWTHSSQYACVHQRTTPHIVYHSGKYYRLKFPSRSWIGWSTSTEYNERCGSTVVPEISWDEPFGSPFDQGLAKAESLSNSAESVPSFKGGGVVPLAA